MTIDRMPDVSAVRGVLQYLDDGKSTGAFPVADAAPVSNAAALKGAQAALRTGIDRPMMTTAELLTAASALMQRYRAGKATLEARVAENEQWFRLQHWRAIRDDRDVRQTAWLYAACVNKHADFIDNKPECSVLAREPGDQETATALSKIVPVVLKRAGWDASYDEGVWDKVKYGGAIYAVYWDRRAEKGLGQVAIRTIDVFNIFWQPGIERIEESANVFNVELVDRELIKRQYDGVEGIERIGKETVGLSRYRYNESIDTSDKCAVINWYYKVDDGERTLLHYVRYVDDVLLYASETDPACAGGWYNDGSYPFVIDSYYPEKGSPFGFGTIDAMLDTQTDIDLLSSLLVKNAKQALRRRYFSIANGGVNEEEFADLDVDIVHVAGQVDDRFIREIQANPVAGNYLELYRDKINELKENAFNRDVNSGGSSGTTTASGIAALQESGSKASRDAISNTYKAFERICELTIERMRQFYTVPRYFRIIGDDQQPEYMSFDNSALTGRQLGTAFGVDFGSKEPVFDLDIKVSKQNVWSRAAQNQDVVSFYNMGFFDPAESTKALSCLEVLEIENKERLRDVIQKNGMREQFERDFLPMLLRAAAAANPQLGAAAAQAAQAAGLYAGEQPQPVVGTGTIEEDQTYRQPQTDVNGNVQQANAYMDRKRMEAAQRTTPR